MTSSNNLDQSDHLEPEQFRVPASDAQGHSERCWFRLQPGHDRQLDRILGSKLFPYRAKGDIIRHALARHLDWIETQEPVPSVTAQVDAILELVREEEFNEDFRTVFDRLGERVGSYVSVGQIDRARSLVSRVLSNIDLMPDNSWRDQYISELHSRFGYLLSGNLDSVADLIAGVDEVT